MASYPTIEQYQELLQSPQTAFIDPELARGTIPTSGLLGTPQVVSGGFALTYQVKAGATKFAVRCFHKPAAELERRYAAVSKKLREVKSPYFVDFEYQARGIKANGSTFPVVKMAWANGGTLGEFVEVNHANPSRLKNLRASLAMLARELERMGIAHGDIQEGNLMVADDGRKVQLIDYDGMYVPELAPLGSSELGHRDYQHPARNKNCYDTKLDRFSFIALDLALRAMCEKPSIWSTTQSGAGVIVFKANDFADPASSTAISEISTVASLKQDAANFASICVGGYAEVPSLQDFITGRGIPQKVVALSSVPSAKRVGYISQHPVVRGNDYGAFAQYVGCIVEVIGQVTSVRTQKTKYGRPMAFINLGTYPGCVSLTLWSSALSTPGDHPTSAWVGRWISIKGLVQPPSQKQKHPAASIQVEQLKQIIQLSEQEALYRTTTSGAAAGSISRRSNADIFATMQTGVSVGRVTASPPNVATARQIPAQAQSRNQQLLDQMLNTAAPPLSSRGGAQSPRGTRPSTPAPSTQRQHSNVPTSSQKQTRSIWFWVAAIIGVWILFSLLFKR